MEQMTSIDKFIPANYGQVLRNSFLISCDMAHAVSFLGPFGFWWYFLYTACAPTLRLIPYMKLATRININRT